MKSGSFVICSETCVCLQYFVDIYYGNNGVHGNYIIDKISDVEVRCMELVQNINREIYEARLKGIPVKRLSEKYGISEGCVRTVCSRENKRKD